MSDSYQRDNVTVWSGIDYFCGFPTFEANVYDESEVLVFTSTQEENTRNFTTLKNSESTPPYSYTSLNLYSTDNSDHLSSYTVTIKVSL